MDHKPKLNYLKLINQFWRVKRQYNLTSNQSLLYLGLLDKCNSLNWKNPFRESERYLSKALNISVNTIRKDRIKLVECGLIKYSLPEKASKSVEGSAIYFIVENSATASTVAAVEVMQPHQNATSTASTTEAQPHQNATSTASTTEANNKLSYLNYSLNSFYKAEIENNYSEDELKKSFNSILTSIQNTEIFRGKTITRNEYDSCLQKYLPEEIETTIKKIVKNPYGYNIEVKTISEILDCFTPGQRETIETFFTNTLKRCNNLLKMPIQLTLKEKHELLTHSSTKNLKDSIMTVEDRPDYRKGQSVYMAVKKNLELTGNWK